MFHDEAPDLSDFCNNLSGKCIILGDMKIHFDFPRNPSATKLLSSLDMFNFSQAGKWSNAWAWSYTWLGYVQSQMIMCYTLHDLPNVFNNFFLHKVLCIHTDLIQLSLTLTSCRLTDQQVDSNFHLFHTITEAELKETILKSKSTSCSLDLLPTSLLEFVDNLPPALTNIVSFSLFSCLYPWVRLNMVGMLWFLSDINQLSLPTPLYSVLVSVSAFMVFSTAFHSINSPDNSLLFHSVLLVLFLSHWSFQLYRLTGHKAPMN